MNLFAKKKKLGMQQKARPKDEISREYNMNAIEAGHKGKMIQEFLAEAERLQGEVDEHYKIMRRATAELRHLPPEPTKPEQASAESKPEEKKE